MVLRNGPFLYTSMVWSWRYLMKISAMIPGSLDDELLWNTVISGLEWEYPQGKIREPEKHLNVLSSGSLTPNLLHDGSSDPQPVLGTMKRKHDQLRVEISSSGLNSNAPAFNSRFQGNSNSDGLQLVSTASTANEGQMRDSFYFDSSFSNVNLPSFPARLNAELVGPSNLVQKTNPVAINTPTNLKDTNPTIRTKVAHPISLSSDGRIREPLLNRVYSYFWEQLNMNTKDDSHRDSPIKETLQAVLGSSGSVADIHEQRRENATSAYRNLIAWLYELHENLMNRFEIPVHNFKENQIKLFNWLQNEVLFPPENTNNLFLEEFQKLLLGQQYITLDGPLSSAREIVIRLLSQIVVEIENFIRPASDLLKLYLDQMKIDYSLVSRVSEIPQEPSQLEKNINFHKTFLTISQRSFDNVFSTNTRSPSYNDNPERNPLVPFLSHYRNLSAMTAKTLGKYIETVPHWTITYHPTLPIGVLCSSKEIGLGSLRILDLNKKNHLLYEKLIKSKLNKLIVVLDRIHTQLLVESNVSKSKSLELRKTLIKWLVKVVFEPEDSIAVLGIVQVDGFFAPWDKETDKNSFGNIQTQLIYYLATDQKDFEYPQKILQDLSAFILSTWYQDA